MSIIYIDGSGASRADHSGIAIVCNNAFVAIRVKKQGCNLCEMEAFKQAVDLYDYGTKLHIVTDSKHVLAHHETRHKVEWRKRCSNQPMKIADLLCKFICHAGGLKISGFWSIEDIPRYERAVTHFRREVNDTLCSGVPHPKER